MATQAMDPFLKSLSDILNNSFISLGLSLGQDLNLFEALASVSSKESPASSAEVAEKAGKRERYVREWLCLMVCGKIINVDENGERFWIPEERLQFLTGTEHHPIFVLNQNVVMCAKAYPLVKELFNTDGPFGLDNDVFDEFHKRMEAFTIARHKLKLLSDFLPLIGIKDKLENGGAQVLDVGCGRGRHSFEFASHFPKSFFTGIDISLEAVIGANKQRDEANEGLDNLSFLEMNGQNMKEEWTDKFDWVTIFDACHDQTRPDKSLKEIHRVLKPDGVFSMLEIDGSSNVFEDAKRESASFLYGVSLFHCLPVGTNEEGALGLGTMWGRKRAIKLLEDAGFSQVEVIPTEFFQNNVLYLCRK